MLFSKKCEAALQLLEEQASAAESAVSPASAANAAAVAGGENEGPAADAPVSAAAAAAAAKPGSLSVEATKEGIVVKRQMSVCITQPRRVAAVSLARRVAEEMGSPELVGYQVRPESLRWSLFTFIYLLLRIWASTRLSLLFMIFDVQVISPCVSARLQAS